jgi:hypothetical protein
MRWSLVHMDGIRASWFLFISLQEPLSRTLYVREDIKWDGSLLFIFLVSPLGHFLSTMLTSIMVQVAHPFVFFCQI